MSPNETEDLEGQSQPEPSRQREDVPNPDNTRLEGQSGDGIGINEPGREPPRQNGSVGGESVQPDWFAGTEGQPYPVSFKVDNTVSERLEGASREGCKQEQKSVRSKHGGKHNNGRTPSRSDWLEAEYDFRGVAHGVSDRVGRLKGLGNAVVPQVAYLVARAVRQHAEENGGWK